MPVEIKIGGAFQLAVPLDVQRSVPRENASGTIRRELQKYAATLQSEIIKALDSISINIGGSEYGIPVNLKIELMIESLLTQRTFPHVIDGTTTGIVFAERRHNFLVIAEEGDQANAGSMHHGLRGFKGSSETKDLLTLGLIDRHEYELTAKGIKELERLDQFGPFLHDFDQKWQFIEEMLNISYSRAYDRWFFKNDYLILSDVNDLGMRELGTEGEHWCRDNLFEILHEKMKQMERVSISGVSVNDITRTFERAFIWLETKYLPEFLSSKNKHIREACEHAVKTRSLVEDGR